MSQILTNTMRKLLIFCVFVFDFVIGGVIDCPKQCANPDYTDANYKPQQCAKFCKSELPGQQYGDSQDLDLHKLWSKVDNLSAMVIAILVLVIVMLFALTFFLLKNSDLSNAILKVWSHRRKDHNVKKPVTDGSRIANYTSGNTYAARNPSYATVANHNVQRKCPNDPKLEIAEKRTRKASESTCPDEHDVVEVNGYDNLGMSTSTLSTHSRPSSPSSPTSYGTAVSMATLNTTMTTVQLDSTGPTPNTNANSPRSTP